MALDSSSAGLGHGLSELGGNFQCDKIVFIFLFVSPVSLSISLADLDVPFW